MLNEIWYGNCIDLIDNIEDNTINMVITSPPYNVNIDGYEDNLDYNKYLDFLKTVFAKIYVKLTIDGRIAINIGDQKMVKSLLMHI